MQKAGDLAMANALVRSRALLAEEGIQSHRHWKVDEWEEKRDHQQQAKRDGSDEAVALEVQKHVRIRRFDCHCTDNSHNAPAQAIVVVPCTCTNNAVSHST